DDVLEDETSANGATTGDQGMAEEDEEDLDTLDLEEVPDLDAPPVSAPPAAPAPAPTGRGPRPPSRAPAAGPGPDNPAGAAGGASRSQAVVRIGALRAAKAGGVPSGQQRMAYRNIVARELGEEKARALAQGLFQAPPERLGPEQLDALVSWGKQDTFAEEVELVLAALRAERARAAAADQAPTNGESGNVTQKARRTRRKPEE